ncbi:hypothetical protein Sjap_017882 [Stephania japonica]|uniref:Uncharacterized protein n=1 Tax=Stephania japonica TaxID=461633 RepID=A0AAP0NIS1_9MAGN
MEIMHTQTVTLALLTAAQLPSTTQITTASIIQDAPTQKVVPDTPAMVTAPLVAPTETPTNTPIHTLGVAQTGVFETSLTIEIAMVGQQESSGGDDDSSNNLQRKLEEIYQLVTLQGYQLEEIL